MIPLSPSSRPTPPVSRSTGATSTPRSARKRWNEAASCTGISRRRSSRTVVERNAMRGLVALAAGERRAVALGEESEAEADDEEGSGGDCIARVPRQRERGEPKPERAAAGEPLDEAEPWSEHPCDEHRGSEGDQAA